MLTIIHGSDTALSRKYFLEEKQKHLDAVLLEADQVNLTDLAQIFEGGGLFGETKHLFIEQFLTKRKKNADYKNILTYLETNAKENSILLWEGKELERSAFTGLKTAVNKAFKLPQTLFQLLDALSPHKNQILIRLFHQIILTTETEMVFFMLIRQFRILLAIQKINKQEAAIEEINRLAPWQITKIEKQAYAFDSKHLLNLYNKLYDIEVGQKTGGLTTPLVSAIDFFLLSV